MAGTVRALLVGIDDYLAITPLAGCGNDVAAAEQVLRVRAESTGAALEVRTLRDAEATREALIATFFEHLGRTGPDDVAVFWYSGHGSQERAPESSWHAEPDRLIETLVPYDARTPDVFDLADKELAQLLGLAARRGGHVLAVLDCCHSGGGTRTVDDDATGGVRAAPADDRIRPPGVSLSLTTTRGLGDAKPAARWVALSACRSDQKAKERPVRGVTRGVLSAGLERALTGAIGPLSYRDIHRMCSAATLDLVADQSPQLEVAEPGDLDKPFLGGAAVLAAHPFTVSIRGGRWLLDGGVVHGLPDIAVGRTEIALFPIGAAQGGASPASAGPLARGVLSAVRVGESDVRITDGEGALDPARTYRASVGRAGTAPGGPEGHGTAGAGAAGGRTSTGDPGGGPAGEGAGDAGGDPARAAHIGRWHDLLDRRNPGTTIPVGTVDVAVEQPDGTPLPVDGTVEVRCPPGQRWAPARIRVVNRLGPTLFCALFALTQDHGVVPLLPGGGAWLGAGEEAWVLDATGEPTVRMTVAPGRSRAVDVLKLFVSTVEFDAQQMQQAELGADTSRGLTLDPATLDADAAAVSAQDWTTAEWVITTLAP
ncbi:caspase family protein [Occultella gossypii]|uniref:Caspase family protein n=1 Tax=Occultella gossypii TaxID=2800820 RepID=A0ABS7S303_9MICO|nr:caspase family protein [Occultella gossypii]MBZ2194690.1 caspase family protein [Occultella gossypii]